MTLTPEDFTPFYQQVHGDPPFPWQADLARQVLAERSWPQLIDVPTGMGKTALLDIAVFIAAATSQEPVSIASGVDGSSSSSTGASSWTRRTTEPFCCPRRLSGHWNRDKTRPYDGWPWACRLLHLLLTAV